MDFSPLSFSDLTQCSNITHKGISEVKCRFCKVPFHCGSVAQWGSNQPAALSCSSPTEQFVFAKALSRSPADFRHKTNFFRLWGCIFISLRLLQRHNTFSRKNLWITEHHTFHLILLITILVGGSFGKIPTGYRLYTNECCVLSTTWGWPKKKYYRDWS